MFKCYLENISNGKEDLLSDVFLEVHDDSEFIIRLEISDHNSLVCPVVTLGDIDIEVKFISQNNKMAIYQSSKGGFFENAFFLNYFGECELVVSVGEIRKSYIIEVNVTGYKASIANEMLLFLSNNADDILQTCFSKSKIGFSPKIGKNRNVIKISSLTKTIELIESLFHDFKVNSKYDINHKLEFNSNKPMIVDDVSARWLSENMDELVLSNSQNYKLRIKQKYYQVDIPNSITSYNTDLKENRVLHQFVLVALNYLYSIRRDVESQIGNVTKTVEYSEYVKFDSVIKNMINPILMVRMKMIDNLISRMNHIHLFFKTVIPVKKTVGDMPVQTSYSLRHSHYARTFNQIAEFYNASDADKSSSEFLLGLRNLSQVFELCCLYDLVRYFKQIGNQVRVSWISDSMKWNSGNIEELNVLANNFVFENEHYKYILNYEKKFYSFSTESSTLQAGNLVRIDQSNNYYEPDFSIKVINKKTNDYYFIILDAKFSRSYKMRNSKADKSPSVLQTVYTKYSTNLRAYKDGDLVNLTRYVGVIFGLSKSESEQKRLCMFSQHHDIDGIAPIFPFAAADFISFSEDSYAMEGILDKYISQ